MSDPNEPAPRPRFTPLIERLPSTTPFVGPETQERVRGRPFIARLGANEHGFGPSAATRAALAAAAGQAWMYGDPEGFALRQALAERLGAPRERILLGEGIDGLLGLACRLMLREGDRAAAPRGGYPTFGYHVAGFGGRLETVPYLAAEPGAPDRADPIGLANRAAETGARLLYLANPDNPMGGVWPAEAVRAMIAATPDDCLILLDEAYLETAPEGSAPPLSPQPPNLLRLRTFSKAYGLAGLRIGYAIGAPRVIEAFQKIRNHFGVGRLSQIGALAALADEDGLAQARRSIAASRERITRIAAEAGLAALPSAANFVAIDCGRGGVFARAVLKTLIEADVFVRAPGAPPLDRCVRVSCGPEVEMDRFAAALPEALAAAERGAESA
ncbi:MAG: pyridoxal phosphate-dependent aminotransferase [Pseudomonadota bacterium]